MKIIKCESFDNGEKLCDFVNSHGIKKEDIQQIIYKDDGYEILLFYWDL